jgi:hypothetical protein
MANTGFWIVLIFTIIIFSLLTIVSWILIAKKSYDQKKEMSNFI